MRKHCANRNVSRSPVADVTSSSDPDAFEPPASSRDHAGTPVSAFESPSETFQPERFDVNAPFATRLATGFSGAAAGVRAARRMVRKSTGGC
jgi:hypothetical protein